MRMSAGKRLSFGTNQYAVAKDLQTYTGAILTGSTLQLFHDNGTLRGIQIGDDNSSVAAEFDGSAKASYFHGKTTLLGNVAGSAASPTLAFGD